MRPYVSLLCALALVACGALLVPLAHTGAGQALVVAALVAAPASALTDLLGRRPGMDPWLTAFAMGAGGVAAVVVALVMREPWTTWLLVGVASGALSHAVEGAEDDRAAGARALDQVGGGPDDAMVGIAASGRTPFVLGALEHARARGAATIALCCAPGAPAAALAEIAITSEVGPEVVAGSTRMKAGSAQKMVLNMLSTAAMVRTGRVWGNLMVEVRGRVRVIQDPAWLQAQVEALTDALEAPRPQPWSVSDAPGPFVAAQIRGIVGVEIDVAAMTGKWKASQNRPDGDRLGVIDGLTAAGHDLAAAIPRPPGARAAG